MTCWYIGGHMKARKALADIVESIVGVVYVDCGFDLQSLLEIMRLEPIVMLNMIEMQPQPFTMLLEACQNEGKTVERAWGKNWAPRTRKM